MVVINEVPSQGRSGKEDEKYGQGDSFFESGLRKRAGCSAGDNFFFDRPENEQEPKARNPSQTVKSGKTGESGKTVFKGVEGQPSGQNGQENGKKSASPDHDLSILRDTCPKSGHRFHHRRKEGERKGEMDDEGMDGGDWHNTSLFRLGI
jgi:hypothetical protein